MTPAEVLAMRDRLSEAMWEQYRSGNFRMHDDSQELADWLIESGWVTEEPKEKSE